MKSGCLDFASSLLCIFAFCLILVNSADPPTTWKEHCFEHNQNLTRVFFNADLAVYYDSNVQRSITWPNKYLTDAWRYVKKTYGGFGGDERLYAIFHSTRYGGGHPHTVFDSAGDNRSVIDCGKNEANAWVAGTGNDLDMPSHEIAHIVELGSRGTKGSPAFPIWGDSKWAEIFIYDLYKGLGREADATRWYNSMINGKDNFPRNGTQWFKNWFYPIYTMNGPKTGSWILNSFFDMLWSNFPKSGNSYARNMNMGEFVHFWSGAVGTDLKYLATSAFGWTTEYENQFNQAKKDFTRLPYNQNFIFYSEINFKGDISLQKLTGQCSNDILSFNDRASSVNTQGQCIRLYAARDCQQASKIVSNDPRNECPHDNFGNCGFNDVASSFNNC